MSWGHYLDRAILDHFTIRPEDVPHCVACGDQGGTEECAAIGCDKRLHPSCAIVCTACKKVACDEHVDLDGTYELCPKCAADAERLEPMPEGVAV